MRKLDLLGHEPRVVWGVFIFIPLLLLFEPTGVAKISVYFALVWSQLSASMILVDGALPQLSAKYRHRLSIGLIVFFILILLLEGVRFMLLR
ncbi:MAG: hypothetical protein OXL96_22095 [Candidatus Poribacteria bacterium]|nr:hypothetical protein [Candidatus Poribacteria bacterium]